MKSITRHPKWEEYRDQLMNLTGFYEDEDFLYIAEEAHRCDGHLARINKVDLVKQLDGIKTDDDWDALHDSDLEVFLDRI